MFTTCQLYYKHKLYICYNPDMYKRWLTKLKALNREKQVGLVVGVILLLALIVLLIAHLSQPTRSVAAYCVVYKQEVVELGHSGGDTYTYSSSVFPNTSSNNPDNFILAFDKLDVVAPQEIEPQVKTVRDVFAEMKHDPTQTLSAAFNGLPAEDAVTQWTQEHCGI